MEREKFSPWLLTKRNEAEQLQGIVILQVDDTLANGSDAGPGQTSS